MEKGSASVRNPMYSSRLPPKIPVPAISQSYAEYVPSSGYGSRVNEKGVEWNPHHQRTTSESFLVLEKPSWFDDLLDEPETTVHKDGHRCASSDSIDVASVVNRGYLSQNDNQVQNITPLHSRGCKDFDRGVDPNWARDASVNAGSRARDGIPPIASKGKEAARSASLVSKKSVEKNDSSHGKPSPSGTARSAEQRYAQLSRLKKTQYIAELESNVQALENGNCLCLAELEFVKNHNLIVGLENRSLQDLCETLAHLKRIKYMEQEMLEREIIRLRALCQQQQQQQRYQRSGHGHK